MRKHYEMSTSKQDTTIIESCDFSYAQERWFPLLT